MFYPTKCTWGCRTCLSLFWWTCPTIGSPRQLSLVALRRAYITLLKKSGRHVLEDIEDYRPITLLKTELKFYLSFKVGSEWCFSRSLLKLEWWFGWRKRRDCMTMQTFLIVIWFCSLGISLASKLDAIENTWIVRKGATLELSFPLFPAHGDYGPESFGTTPPVSRIACLPFSQISCTFWVIVSVI